MADQTVAQTIYQQIRGGRMPVAREEIIRRISVLDESIRYEEELEESRDLPRVRFDYPGFVIHARMEGEEREYRCDVYWADLATAVTAMELAAPQEGEWLEGAWLEVARNLMLTLAGVWAEDTGPLKQWLLADPAAMDMIHDMVADPAPVVWFEGLRGDDPVLLVRVARAQVALARLEIVRKFVGWCWSEH